SAALALPPGGDRDQALEIAERLAGIANPETRTLGEAFHNTDLDGDGVVDLQEPRVATPHVWAGLLEYLTAMAHYAPGAFARAAHALPDVTIPDVLAPGVAPPAAPRGAS